MTANADQAKRELQAAGADVQALGTKARASGAAVSDGMKAAQAQITALTREVGTLKSRLDAAAAAEKEAVTEMAALTAKVGQLEAALGRGRGAGGGGAAGSVGNLVAQFNDVGVMMASGQSPLLMAIQQGTQISQVIGPMGAAGAVRTLGSAFIGMLNPVNFAVLAAVASLGLLGNALRGLVGETKSVEDAIDDLDTATKAWRDTASVGVGDLKKAFGTVTPAIIEMQRRLTDLKMTEMLLAAADAATTLGRSLDASLLSLGDRRGNIRDLLGAPQLPARLQEKLTPEVSQFGRAMDTLVTSSNVDAQLEAVRQMAGLIEAAGSAQGKLNDGQRAFLADVSVIEKKLLDVKAAQEGIGSAQQISKARAEEMLTTLQDEARIRELTARYGEESAQVAGARVEIERRAFEAQLAALDITDQMRASLREAWEATEGLYLSGTDLVSTFLDVAGANEDVKRAITDAVALIPSATQNTNMWAAAASAVAAEVRGINAAIAAIGKVSLSNDLKKVELEALRAGQSVSEARRTAQEAEYRREAKLNEAKIGYTLAQKQLETQLEGLRIDGELEGERKIIAARERSAKAGARAGASAAKKDAEAIERFLTGLQMEYDLLVATDPVQKEIIRNREILAKMSDGDRERAEVMIDVNTRLAEQQAEEKQAWADISQASYEALDGLILRGKSATDVVANLAGALADALLQSALLGTGPLAGLFGGAGTGLFGIFGSAMGIPAAATGGYITGPGGPTDDAILARLSNGEYVVNAAATARHRPLLEAINRAPGFASGGMVGSAPIAGGLGADGAAPIVIDLRLSDDLDARIAETSRAVSMKVTRAGLQSYDAKTLPRRMQQVSADPRRIG